MATFIVPAGHTVRGDVINDGDVQTVYGTTINETIEFGGIQYVYGEDIGSTILGSNAISIRLWFKPLTHTVNNEQIVEVWWKVQQCHTQQPRRRHRRLREGG